MLLLGRWGVVLVGAGAVASCICAAAILPSPLASTTYRVVCALLAVLACIPAPAAPAAQTPVATATRAKFS